MTKQYKIKTHRKLEQERLLTKHEYLLSIVDITNRGFMLEPQLIEFADYLNLKADTVKSYLRECERAKLIDREYQAKLQVNLVILKKPALAFVRNIPYTSCPATFKSAQSSDIQVYRNMMKVENILRLASQTWAKEYRKSEERNLAVVIRKTLTAYGSSLHLKQEELPTVYAKTAKKGYYYATQIQIARAKSNIKNAKLSENEQRVLNAYYEDIQKQVPHNFNQHVHALVNQKEDVADQLLKKDDLYTIYNLERFDVYVNYSGKDKICYSILDVNNSLTLEKLDDLYPKLSKHAKHAGYSEFLIAVYTQSRQKTEVLIDNIKIRANQKKHLVLNSSGMIKTEEELSGCNCTKIAYNYMALDKYVEASTPTPNNKNEEIKPNTLEQRVVLGEEF